MKSGWFALSGDGRYCVVENGARRWGELMLICFWNLTRWQVKKWREEFWEKNWDKESWRKAVSAASGVYLKGKRLLIMRWSVGVCMAMDDLDSIVQTLWEWLPVFNYFSIVKSPSPPPSLSIAIGTDPWICIRTLVPTTCVRRLCI